MVGIVAKHQVPLFMSFDEEEVNFVASTMADALERSYQIIDMFQFPDGYGDYDE